MASTNKQGKMAGYLNWRMKVTFVDSRTMQGQMLAFDKHMNLVLADTEEFRRIKRKNVPKPGNKDKDKDEEADMEEFIETEEKRTLGLTIIRGAHIVCLEPLSPPPQDPSARLGKSTPGGLSSLPPGPGVVKPAGRGISAPPSSLGYFSLPPL